MRQRSVILSLFFVAIMMSSTVGCIGLTQAREALEGMRSEPKQGHISDSYSLNHTFTGLSAAPFFASEEIKVNERVTEINIYFRATMDFADNIQVGEARFVNAKLLMPDGSVFWEEEATNSTRPQEIRTYPPFVAGIWTLEVEARGYGADLVIVDSYDDFMVKVTVEQQCTFYPVEDDVCAFD
jgi:hypothetical protein